MGQLPSKTYETQIVSLARVLQTFREEENADVLMEATLKFLREEFDYRLLWIALYDRLEHRLIGKGGKLPNEDSKFLHKRFPIDSGDLMEQIIIQQRSLVIPDLRQEKRAGEWQKVAQQFEIQGTLIFPIRHKDRCFGIVLLGSHLWGVSPRAADKAQLSLLFGNLATTLYQLELEWQWTTAKRTDEPLFQILEQLQSNSTLAQRLESAISLTHEFINPTHTNLYNYSAEKLYFWHRVGNRQLSRSLGNFRNSSGIQAKEVYDFYRLLASGQVVAIGAGRSPLKPDSTTELMSRLKARSLLAAPILVHEELLGFLSVEDSESRIWETAERNFIRAVANAIALVIGSEEVGTKFEQTKADITFAAEVTQILTRSDHPQTALNDYAALLCQHFQVNGFWLLQAKEDTHSGEVLITYKTTSSTMPYSVFYSYSTQKRRQDASNELPLKIKDWYQMIKKDSTVAIDDLGEDEQLESSQKILGKMGVRSLLICPIGDQTTGGLLMLTHSEVRTWQATDTRLFNTIAPQLDWILKLNAQKRESQAFSHQAQMLQMGLNQFWESFDSTKFEEQWLEYLATLLAVPIAILLTWDNHVSENEEVKARVSTVVGTTDLPDDLTLSVKTDPLIQSALGTDGFYCTDEAEVDCQWLQGLQLDQVLAIALKTKVDKIQPTGMIVFASTKKRHWSANIILPVTTLIQQFAGVRNYLQLSESNISTTVDSLHFQLLHWYKHRALEILHHSVADSIGALLTMEINQTQEAKQGQSLRQLRQDQLLRYLEGSITAIIPTLTEEQTELVPHFTTIPVSGFLKRSLQMVESIYQQRKLWTRVYNPGRFNVFSDRIKLECVLYELLSASCNRAPAMSQIELWCRPLSIKGESASKRKQVSFLELSIIEQETTLENSESSGRNSQPTPPWQVLAAPVQPESTEMKICQQVMQILKGKLQFYHLKDGRYLSRLILPMSQE